MNFSTIKTSLRNRESYQFLYFLFIIVLSYYSGYSQMTLSEAEKISRERNSEKGFLT